MSGSMKWWDFSRALAVIDMAISSATKLKGANEARGLLLDARAKLIEKWEASRHG